MNMKHFFLVFTFALAACFAASAQDIITTVGGEQIKAKVVEVGPESVTYKRMDNPNGPLYTTRLSEVRSILYEDGYLERYNSTGAPKDRPEFNAPSATEVSYKEIAGHYNPALYVNRAGDPYIPVLSGLSSFFLPGLGQCLDGEWGRGLGIFAANVGFGTLEILELSALFYSAAAAGSDYLYSYSSYSNYPRYYSSYEDSMAISGGLLTLTALTQFVFNVWNICDAVNIAKVKNMYYQDVHGALGSIDMHIEPHLALAPTATGLQPAAGLSLKVSF